MTTQTGAIPAAGIDEDREVGAGSSVTPAQMNCQFCDELISSRAKKCRHCGETLDVSLRKAEEAIRASERNGNVYMNAAVSAPAEYHLKSRTKSRITAFLLAWFLGGLGGHKFYLNRAGQGFLYLIFVWTFIPSIIAFIEGLVYLTMSDERFWEKYG